MNTHRSFAIAAIVGALGIALGAFGAHGLPGVLEQQGLSDEVVRARMTLFETAVRYHMYAALGLGLFALAGRTWPSRGWAWSFGLLLAGAAIFCGLVYGLVFAEGTMRAVLGATVPIGGTLMIAGWIAAAITAFRTKS